MKLRFIRKRHIQTALWMLGVYFYVSLCTCLAAHPKDKKVLVINSYHPNYVWTDRMTSAILNGLKSIVSDENICVEYLDARRSMDDSVYYELIRKYIAEKYARQKFDLIFSCDDFAMNFLYQHQQKLFPGTPVVFGGVNVFPIDSIRQRPNFIGVYEGIPVRENLDLIAQVQPQVRCIRILCDPTHLGSGMYAIAWQAAQSWKHPSIQTQVVKVQDINQLQKDVQRTGMETAYLLIAIHKDARGHYFSFVQHLKAISSVSGSPIYGLWGSLLIGNGSMGGYINDPYTHGREIARIGVQLLQGADIRRIKHPLQTRYLPRFDYRVLEKYGIPEENLPAHAVLYFKPESFVEKYQKLVIAVLVVGVFLVVIIVILYLAYRRTAALSKQLHILNLHQAQATQETSQLIYSLSHTTRLDACNIEGYLNLYEFSEDKLENKDDVQMLMRGIQTSVLRLKQTLDDIIEIGSRSKEPTEEVAEVLVARLADKVVQSLKPQLDEIQAQINISEKTKYPFFYYASEIQALVQELLLNSIRFRHPDRQPDIRIAIQSLSAQKIEIRFEDNGLGMDLSLYGNKLFRLFERFHSSRSGKGMGLYLLKSIVDWRGGDISINSQVSEGTILTITLRNQR